MTMHVELSEHSRELARAAVQAGHAKDVCDAVAIGLLLLEQAQLDELTPNWDASYANEVNAKINEGLADIRAGRSVAADKAYFEGLRARVAVRASTAATERG